jgi:hypothetical protein
MPVLPDKRLEQIQFFETRLPAWQAAPAAAIGLTTAQINALASATQNARDAFNAAQTARAASKAATTAYHTASDDMRELGADLIKTIKAFAELQASPGGVYALAQIPEPSPPEPLGPPGKPGDFAVALETGGAITLSWSAQNARASSGAFFTVARKLPGEADFAFIGGTRGSTTESRRIFFTDTTVPSSAAAQGVQYRVRGQRGTVVGQYSDGITIEFGVDGAGAINVSAKPAPSEGDNTTPLRVAA